MLTNRRSTMMLPRQQSFPPPPREAPPETEPHCRPTSILTATTPDLPGYRIVRVVGLVHGLTTVARKDTKTFLKAIGNGSEARSLTHVIYNAREQATERMVRDCVSRGGNAIVGMGFGESEVLGFAQISTYGTAVYIEKDIKA